MIYGIGIDNTSVQRIEAVYQKFNSKFLHKILTISEIAQIKQKLLNHQQIIAFLAKRFAAKEAFAKALGTGIGRGINFNNIEIFNNHLGKPQIRVINLENSIFDNLNLHQAKFFLSLSDEKILQTKLATAMVVISY